MIGVMPGVMPGGSFTLVFTQRFIGVREKGNLPPMSGLVYILRIMLQKNQGVCSILKHVIC